MKRLARYLSKYKMECVLGPLFKMLEASFELFVPIVIAQIIDIGIGKKNIGHIWNMVLILVVLGIIGLVCSITAQYFAAKAAVGFSARIKHELLKHIQGLAFTEIDKLGTNTLITRMTSDVNQVQNGVNLALRLLLRSPFVVFGAMIMAFTIDFSAAMIFVVTIPLLAIVVFGVMLISIPLYKKVQSCLEKVLRTTRESLTGARVIRAFCKELSQIKVFELHNDELTALNKFVGRIAALLNPLTYIIINAAIIYLIWTGAIQVQTGLLTQGAVVALYNYMSQILVELIKMANLIISMTKAWASAGRIAHVFDVKSEMELIEKTNEAEDNDEMVRFENVSLAYKGSKEEALSGISFSVKKGEIIGVIGGTGSGKSSLVNMIPRYYDATKGNIYIKGRDIRQFTTEELSEFIGVAMQRSVLFSGTIRENVKWGKKDATDDEVNEAIRIAQAKEIVENKEGGLDFKVAQNGRNLSGGQKQRLTIARALVKKPEILILDDSASALDYATEARLRNGIRGLDTTVFIVSQRMVSIMEADKIIVLDDGEIVGIGTHKDLLENCEIYQEICYSQVAKEEC